MVFTELRPCIIDSQTEENVGVAEGIFMNSDGPYVKVSPWPGRESPTAIKYYELGNKDKYLIVQKITPGQEELQNLAEEFETMNTKGFVLAATKDLLDRCVKAGKRIWFDEDRDLLMNIVHSLVREIRKLQEKKNPGAKFFQTPNIKQFGVTE